MAALDGNLQLGPDVYDYHGPYLNKDALPRRPLQRSLELAADAILEADYLLIGAGAGMGVDSGLQTYASVCDDVPAFAARGLSYDTLCRPSLLASDPETFLGFWGHCFNAYADADPHEGYAVLGRWCAEKAAKMGSDAAAFVYSSNVDGHFHRAMGFGDGQVLELHGRNRSWFCPACAAAPPPRSDRDGGGTALSFADLCRCPPDGFRFPVDAATGRLRDCHRVKPAGETERSEGDIHDGRDREEGGGGEKEEEAGGGGGGGGGGGWFGPGLPRCRASGCPLAPPTAANETSLEGGALLRPAVHMFDERDAALLGHLRRQEGRYVAWECDMEKAVRGIIDDDKDDDKDDDARKDSGGDRVIEGVADGEEGRGGGKERGRTGKRVVLVEVGCGLRVPSVRMEMEEVFRDLLDALLREAGHAPSKPAQRAAPGFSVPAEEGAAEEARSQQRAGGGDAVVSEDLLSSATRRVTLVRINKEWPQVLLPCQADRRLRFFELAATEAAEGTARAAASAGQHQRQQQQAVWESRSIEIGAGALEALVAIDAIISQRRGGLSADASSSSSPSTSENG